MYSEVRKLRVTRRREVKKRERQRIYFQAKCFWERSLQTVSKHSFILLCSNIFKEKQDFLCTFFLKELNQRNMHLHAQAMTHKL